jgi:regulator of protease activity HflC (stomatin/prohibitin superfamily)
MADITMYPLVRHLRATSTTHVRHLRSGRLVHDGTGLAFFFRPLSAVLSEIPVDDRELPMLFHARTADFHDMTVQASVTFRFTDPAVASARLDFSIDAKTGRWRGTPLEQLAGLLAETAQQQVLGLIAASSLLALLSDGIDQIRDRILRGLVADTRLAETGIAVIGARVVALRPEPEVEKALQTPARESLQQEADRATYERRAVAVERERAISENELASQIELARREEQLVAQRGANARRQAEEAAGASRIEAEAQALREERLAQARAQGTRVLGEAKAAAESALLAAYRDLPDGQLLGLAVKDLAARLPQIGSLTVTPDLLSGLAGALSAGSAGNGSAVPAPAGRASARGSAGRGSAGRGSAGRGSGGRGSGGRGSGGRGSGGRGPADDASDGEER